MVLEGSDYHEIAREYRTLTEKGYEPLVPLSGDEPRYYSTLYKPSLKTKTLFRN